MPDVELRTRVRTKPEYRVSPLVGVKALDAIIDPSTWQEVRCVLEYGNQVRWAQDQLISPLGSFDVVTILDAADAALFGTHEQLVRSYASVAAQVMAGAFDAYIRPASHLATSYTYTERDLDEQAEQRALDLAFAELIAGTQEQDDFSELEPPTRVRYRFPR